MGNDPHMERHRFSVPRLSSRYVAMAAVLVASVCIPAGALHAQAPAQENLVPISIELPKPMFEGTPQNMAVPNLQKPLGRPRDPFLAPAGVTNVAKGRRSRAATPNR